MVSAKGQSMASKGPRPQGTKVRLLHGDALKRKTAVAEWHPEVKLPKMPRHLRGTARTLWRELGAELLRQGLVTELDRCALSMLCTSWARSLLIEAELAQLPVGGKEAQVLNRALIATQKLCTQLASEFGMSPAWRHRAQAERTPPLEPSPWDEFV
jgi:P27 family predicted phage terminase small subunit